jgi:hypothetical protein
MARQLIAGSIGTRKGITIRPDAGELEAIEQLAASWDCSLSQAAMRLVRTGLASPERSQPSERATVVYGHLAASRSRDEIHAFTSSAWGLNHKQTDQLINEAKAMLQREAELARPVWLDEALGRLKKIEAEAAKRGNQSAVADARRAQYQARKNAIDAHLTRNMDPEARARFLNAGADLQQQIAAATEAAAHQSRSTAGSSGSGSSSC